MNQQTRSMYQEIINNRQIPRESLLNHKQFNEERLVELFSSLLPEQDTVQLRQVIIKVASLAPPTIAKVDFVNQILREVYV